MSAFTASTRTRHPGIELLARYGAVLRAAWAQRHELAGPRRLADEAAFLPAALSLQETPVHPAPRRAMLAIVALFCIALAWSWFGQVDIVAVARGRIVVSERTKVVQPLESGVVRAIHVRDGQRVAAGELLLELDPTNPQADRSSVQQQLQAAEQEAARSQALLAALGSGAAPRLAQHNAEAQALLQAEWADFDARWMRLQAEEQRRQAEATTAQELVAKIQATLPIARQREAELRALASDGFAARHAAEDRTRERVELERDLATQQARITEVNAALHESRHAAAALRADAARQWSERATQARLRAGQLRQEGAKTQQREQLTRLLAPVAGTVQQLAVHTQGGVVTPAQALLVIVPEAAEVTAEVALENKDIGFVRAGQAAVVKLDTFPFTRYGTVPATVQRVSADAVVDDKLGPVFPATLRLQAEQLMVDGQPLRLSPGMQLSAEVHTGRRRVIDFLLAPTLAALDQALRER